MNDELRFNEKLLQFLYSIGLPPQRIFHLLICLLVLGAIVGVLYFSNLEGLAGGSKRTDDVTSTDPDENKRLTNEANRDLETKIDELSFFDPSEMGYIVLSGEVQKQTELIAKVRQHENISLEQLKKLDGIQLRNLQTLAVRSMEAGVTSGGEMTAFVDFAETLASSDDEKLRDTARFSLVRTAAVTFTVAPTEANAKTAIETIKARQTTLVDQHTRSEMIFKTFLDFRENNPTNKFVDQCIETLGTTIDTSTEPKTLELAATIRDFRLLSKIQLSTIEDRIRFRDSSGLEDLDEAFRVIEANPSINIETWELLIQSYEASLSNGQLHNFSAAHMKASELVAKLPDSDPRKAQLSEALDRQKQRAQSVGTPFDLSGNTFNGKEITQSAKGFSVLCFVDRSKVSAAMTKDLVNRLFNGIPFRPIIVFKDDFSEQDQEMIKQIPGQFFVADRQTAIKYFNAFACDNYPYLVLVDGKGIVTAVNLSLVQVANRIASLQKKQTTTD